MHTRTSAAKPARSAATAKGRPEAAAAIVGRDEAPFIDSRPEAVAQRAMIERIHDSPRMVAQRAQVAAIHAGAGVVQRYNRYHSEDLPTGGYAKWLQEVHYTYLSAKRGTHGQLHITFTSEAQPEDRRQRAKNAAYWFNTATGWWNWTASSDDPQLADDDREWYEDTAIDWAHGVETAYLATIPERARPENEFTQWLPAEEAEEDEEEGEGEAEGDAPDQVQADAPAAVVAPAQDGPAAGHP
ncbi:MAG: hypothetical protein JWM26_2260 [Betaproteobacteria bacterium]|nr:hypothetical protein [Betaproteobacteria bacterium]